MVISVSQYELISLIITYTLVCNATGTLARGAVFYMLCFVDAIYAARAHQGTMSPLSHFVSVRW